MRRVTKVLGESGWVSGSRRAEDPYTPSTFARLLPLLGIFLLATCASSLTAPDPEPLFSCHRLESYVYFRETGESVPASWWPDPEPVSVVWRFSPIDIFTFTRYIQGCEMQPFVPTPTRSS